MGGLSYEATMVAAYASSSTTVPPRFDTSITPDGLPWSSGSNIIKLLPISSIVVVKSVPLTAIVAVGVLISIFALLTNPREPDANLAVPLTIFIVILERLGLGS